MIIDTLITDRTADDVEEWNALRQLGLPGMAEEQLAMWNAGMKGAYKASDFNRVSEAYNYLASIMQTLGLISSYTPLKTTWEVGETPLVEQRAAYINGIAQLKNAVLAIGNLPSSLDALTYTDANNIETVLINVYRRIQEMDSSIPHSGEWFSGEIDA